MKTVNCIYCDNEATNYSGHLNAKIKQRGRLRDVKIIAGACDDHVEDLEREPDTETPKGYLGEWLPRMGIRKHKSIIKIPKPITLIDFRKLKSSNQKT